MRILALVVYPLPNIELSISVLNTVSIEARLISVAFIVIPIFDSIIKAARNN